MRGSLPNPFAALAKGWGRRWSVVLVLAAIVVLAGALTVHRAVVPASFTIEAAPPVLPADGFTSAEIKLSSTGRDLRGLRVEADDPHLVSVDSITRRGDFAVISVRAGVLPGEASLRLIAPGVESKQIAIRTRLALSDNVGDGTPDFMRLHDAADRTAFRRWFTLLAEAAYYRKQSLGEVDDCAALLRYAYREALRRHDSAWARAVALPVAPAASDIRQYQYPYTPLGGGLFRIREGRFTAEDLKTGVYAQFADAKTLWRYNSYFVGRDIGRARPGDLLFFRQEGQNLPFHAMIFLGLSQVEPESNREPIVTYHTGPMGKSPGEVRRLTLTELMNFPDPRWRPLPSNPSFLGVYRWNILRGTD